MPAGCKIQSRRLMMEQCSNQAVARHAQDGVESAAEVSQSSKMGQLEREFLHFSPGALV